MFFFIEPETEKSLRITAKKSDETVLIAPWIQTFLLSPTVKAPDPSPERGGPWDTQNYADQLHVPPADQDRGL